MNLCVCVCWFTCYRTHMEVKWKCWELILSYLVGGRISCIVSFGLSNPGQLAHKLLVDSLFSLSVCWAYRCVPQQPAFICSLGANSGPQACKASALQTELSPSPSYFLSTGLTFARKQDLGWVPRYFATGATWLPGYHLLLRRSESEPGNRGCTTHDTSFTTH